MGGKRVAYERMKLLFCLLAISVNVHAHIIGEIFEDTVYGKEVPGRVKIEGGRSKHAPDRRVYQVTFSSRLDSQIDIVVVSQSTGRIVSISTRVPSIENAVLKASYFCEGEVLMPTRAVWGRGLILENKPGIKYKGQGFDVSVDSQMGDNEFRLQVSCPSFW